MHLPQERMAALIVLPIASGVQSSSLEPQMADQLHQHPTFKVTWMH